MEKHICFPSHTHNILPFATSSLWINPVLFITVRNWRSSSSSSSSSSSTFRGSIENNNHHWVTFLLSVGTITIVFITVVLLRSLEQYLRQQSITQHTRMIQQQQQQQLHRRCDLNEHCRHKLLRWQWRRWEKTTPVPSPTMTVPVAVISSHSMEHPFCHTNECTSSSSFLQLQL